MSTDLERRWHEVVKVALVGSARGNLGPGPLPGAARPDDREGTLLAEAAALALWRRAAALPARTTVPPPAPAPDETLPRCSVGATRLLDAFLHGAGGELLPEWLALAARANAGKGVRADETLLPDLLDQGRLRPDLRPDILRVVGERGRWLAAGDPGWRWAVAAVSEEDFATGDRAARLALLAELRATDPARARELVERGFHNESAEDRAAFVSAMARGLGDADEPFLEAALGDRRKEVRAAAAQLLARLPASRLAARMAARARACVSIGKRGARIVHGPTEHERRDASSRRSDEGVGRGPMTEERRSDAPQIGGQATEAHELSGLVVEPPRTCDPEMVRDGIDPSPPRGQGARAFWLRQILAATPLSVWGPPEAVLAAARGSDWEELLVGAFAVAAARQRDVVWAEAILRITRDLEDLLEVLPPPRREAVVAADRGRLWGAVSHLTHAWSERFSRLVAASLEGARVGDLALAAVRLHPVVVAELLARRANLPLIDARVALHKELRP